MKSKIIAILITLAASGCTKNMSVTPAPVESAKVVAAVPVTPEEMQRNFAEAGAVKDQHKILAKMAGNWKVNAKFWLDPSAPPEVSSGRATAKLIYGGRYLTQSYKGEFMGQPFEGQGLFGFDNLSSKFFSTWIDSISTMMMRSEGIADPRGQLVLSSEMICPGTRETVKSEEIVTFIDNNNYRFETYQDRNGHRSKGMELIYTRVR